MEKIKSYVVSESQTIKEAIYVIKNDHARCAIVVNKANKVIGVFSEGDVLNAFLQGIDVHASLKSVIKPSFLYLKEKDLAAAHQLIKKYGITLIPIVDNSFNLKDVITIFEVMDLLSFSKK